MKHPRGFPSRLLCCGFLLLAILWAATTTMAEIAQRPNGFSNVLFNVVLEGKQTPDYVVLSVRISPTEEGTNNVDAQVTFLKEDPITPGYRIALRSFSTRDTTITRADLTGDTLAFDLHLDGRDADKKIRVRGIWDPEAKAFRIKVSGLWSDQTHTTFLRAQWKQIESIELKYPRLLPSSSF